MFRLNDDDVNDGDADDDDDRDGDDEKMYQMELMLKKKVMCHMF